VLCVATLLNVAPIIVAPLMFNLEPLENSTPSSQIMISPSDKLLFGRVYVPSVKLTVVGTSDENLSAKLFPFYTTYKRFIGLFSMVSEPV
jgi:hypothetical protein